MTYFWMVDIMPGQYIFLDHRLCSTQYRMKEIRDWFQMALYKRVCVVTGKRTLLIDASLPTSTLEHLPDLEESLPRFQDQDTILLGDLKVYTQSHNPRIHQVPGLLMEFDLAYFHHHLGTMASPSYKNVVSGAARHIFV